MAVTPQPTGFMRPFPTIVPKTLPWLCSVKHALSYVLYNASPHLTYYDRAKPRYVPGATQPITTVASADS